MVKCKWCKGTGKVYLMGDENKYLKQFGKGICFNCKGTGEGEDGGETIGGAKRPYMIGNQHARREK